MKKPREKPLYAVHPAVTHARAIIENMPEKTGRSLKEWVALLEADGPTAPREHVAWLKGSHGLGEVTAKLVARRAAGGDAEDTDPDAYLAAAPRYVDALYSGDRCALRPIHDLLVAHLRSAYRDVSLCPRRTFVPVYRNRVVAQIRPTTRTRIDLGLALEGATRINSVRLVPIGGTDPKDRITHRLELQAPEDVDDELWRWFEVAYQLDD